KITNNSVKQNKHQLYSLYHNFKTKIVHYLYQTNQNIEHNYKATISIARGLLKLYGKSMDMKYDNIISNTQKLIKNTQHNL
ncbi:exodeoxyribonuclease VII large subunit, partial [Francisella tularensis subsp. holarctica]|nr:exodeoxyribonuclease VII large subunit [Francisella tularensis subsp. holarctica]